MTLAQTATANVEALLAGTKTTLIDVLDAIAAQQQAKKPKADEPLRALPPIPQVSAEQKKDLRTLIARAEKLDLPSTARILSEAERKEAIEVFVQIKAAAKVVADLETALKFTFHGHLDVELEAAKRQKGVPQDARGNYVADGIVSAPGVAEVVARETRGGGAAPLTLADLESLVKDPESGWSHQDFLAATTQTRVVDPVKVMDLVKKDPALIQGLRKVVKLTNKTTQIAVRKVKVGS